MSTKTEICNLAISHLGTGKEIASLAEGSEEASACNRFYDICLQKSLRETNWSFATKFAGLGLVASNPTTEWAYSYQYPSDCLMFRRILSGYRNDTRQSMVPYKIISDGSSGKLIYTDQESATSEYTFNISDTNAFPVDFVMALSLLLASYIAPRITDGDPFKMGQRAMQMYLVAISEAQSDNFNEQQDEEEVDSQFIRTRN